MSVSPGLCFVSMNLLHVEVLLYMVSITMSVALSVGNARACLNQFGLNRSLTTSNSKKYVDTSERSYWIGPSHLLLKVF